MFPVLYADGAPSAYKTANFFVATLDEFGQRIRLAGNLTIPSPTSIREMTEAM